LIQGIALFFIFFVFPVWRYLKEARLVHEATTVGVRHVIHIITLYTLGLTLKEHTHSNGHLFFDSKSYLKHSFEGLGVMEHGMKPLEGTQLVEHLRIFLRKGGSRLP
jgi:hypothetical protein